MPERRAVLTKHAEEQGRARAGVKPGELLREFKLALAEGRMSKTKPRFLLGDDQRRRRRRRQPGVFRYAWPASKAYVFSFRRLSDHDAIVTVLHVRSREA